jgi:hypothetical protein
MKLGVWMKDMPLILDYIAMNSLRVPVFAATWPTCEAAAGDRPLGGTAAVFEQLRSPDQTG